MKVGEKYVVANTARNARNGLIAGKEARIAHLGPVAISVRVFQNGTEAKLLVPRELFGQNFEPERGFVPPNLGYASAIPFTKPYL